MSSTRFAGEALFLGAAAAVISSLPAAVRASDPGVPFLTSWLATSGMLAAPLVAATAIACFAKPAVQQTLTSMRTPERFAAGVVWVTLSVPLFVLVGTVLKATTHHHGLAGATAGVLALATALATALLAPRIADLFGRLAGGSSTRRAATAIGAGAVLMLLFAITRAGRSFLETPFGLYELPPLARAGLVDWGLPVVLVAGLALAVNVGAWSRRMLRTLAAAGACAVVGLTTGGAHAVASSPDLARAVANRTALPGLIAQAAGLVEHESGAVDSDHQ